MPNIKKSHPLVRLWGYARAHHHDMLLASLYSILNKIFDLAPPLLNGAVLHRK
jgi:ATP-binding cassette, subfamily B, bacterial